MNWKHDELANDLAQYVRSKSDRIVWTDMQLGPSGSSRPDVYSVPMSFTRFQPIAYECKVSVSDFRADVTKGKWSDYLRFACAVIFAVPEGLVTKADLPDGCGLIVRGPNGWRTVKGPTMRPLDNLPRDAWVKLLIDGIKREAERNKPKSACIWSATYDIREKIGNQVADALMDRQRAEHHFETATAKLRSAAKDADAAYQKQMEAARERADRDMARINGARVELAQALGLSPSAETHSIVRAARDAAEALDRDDVIQGLRHNLQTIARAVEIINAPPPAIARAASQTQNQKNGPDSVAADAGPVH